MALVINQGLWKRYRVHPPYYYIGWITHAKCEETRPKRLNQEKPIWEWSITRNEH